VKIYTNLMHTIWIGEKCTNLMHRIGEIYTNLMHRIGEKCRQLMALADRLLLISPEKLIELWFLFVLGQHLKTVVVVAYVLLVDTEHRQEHVE